MAQKMTGALVFDERTDRYDIRFDFTWQSSVPLREPKGWELLRPILPPNVSRTSERICAEFSVTPQF